jgi:hypothetical protein
MNYKLFLDDLRNPEMIYENPEEWVMVRNIQEFKEIIIERGAPSEISFDHDLGVVNGRIEEAPEALYWLMYADYIVPVIRVHSDNVGGSLNLESQAKTWHKILIMDGLLKEEDSLVMRLSAMQIKLHRK